MTRARLPVLAAIVATAVLGVMGWFLLRRGPSSPDTPAPGADRTGSAKELAPSAPGPAPGATAGTGSRSIAASKAAEAGKVPAAPADGPRLEGRVSRLPGRTPVEGAEVVLRLLEPAPRSLPARTDAEGRFRFPASGRLGPGACAIQVEASGAAVALVAVDLPSSGTAEVEILVDEGVAVRGTVTDSRGLPVPGALVASAGELDRPDELQRFGAAGLLAFMADAEVPADLRDRVARADEAGRFELRHVPPGAVRLCAAAPGFVPAFRVVEAGGGGGPGRMQVVLEPCGSIAGTAVPVKGGPDQVVWMRTGGTGAVVVPGKDGAFQIPGLLPGRYTLRFDRTVEVSVGAGQAVRVDFSTGGGAVLRGLVRAGKGGFGAAEFALHSLDPADPVRARTCGAAAGGQYRFEGLLPGRYALSALQGTVFRVVEIPAGTPEVVLDVDLAESASLSGRVKDVEGKPVAGAVVRAFPEASLSDPEVAALGEHWVGDRNTRTGDDGSFEIRGLPPAPHVLSVGAPGYGFTNVGPFTPGAHAPLEVVLEPGSGVTVRLLGADGRPVRLGAIGVFDARGILVAEDAGDGLRLRGWGVVPGEYEVIAATPEGPFVRRTGVVVGAETVAIEMRLGVGGDAFLRAVSGKDGGPVAGVSFRVTLADGRGLPAVGGAGQPGHARFRTEVLGAPADRDGVARLAGLPPEDYRAVAVGPDGRRGEVLFRVEEGRTTEATATVR